MLAALENQHVAPSWETVMAICDALGVSADDFRRPPSGQRPPGKIGRPRKPRPPTEEPKRPRGRPRKDTQAEARAVKGKARQKKGT